MNAPLDTFSSLLVSAALLFGCASTPAVDPGPLPTPPGNFRESDEHRTESANAEPQEAGEWWQVFGDPILNSLVSRAMQRNESIQVAAARIAQARSLLSGAEALRLPQINVAAGGSRGTQPPSGTLLSAGANLTYEPDLFGKISRASEVATLDVRTRQALYRRTLLLVQTQVTQTYLTLRALDNEANIVGDTALAFQNTLKLTESRFRAGEASELEVVRVRTEAADTESDALSVRVRRAQHEHALAVLTGETASSFSITPTAWDAPLPVIPAGVPSSVLRRRPDVVASQEQLFAAQARVGVAKAEWFPDLQMTVATGYASSDLSNLFKWSARAWGIGALLSLPVFDGGRREARILDTEADLDAALATHREQILLAFKDVEDQLSTLRLLREQARTEATAASSASRATALSSSRYRNGFISQFELLDAQRSELRSQRKTNEIRSAQYQATVALIQALGGGW